MTAADDLLLAWHERLATVEQHPTSRTPAGILRQCIAELQATEALTPADADWRALREWLIETRGTAQDCARGASNVPAWRAPFEAQVTVLSSALDFMDERERAAMAEAAGGAV